VDRRRFVGQLVFGSAVLSSLAPRPQAAARQAAGGLRVKFIGMMGYVTRSDGSMVVAMPGQHSFAHYTHVPFLMARTGSRIAAELGLTAMPSVVAGAFDDRLVDEPAGAFVFRCLDGCDAEIDAAAGKVDNQATQLAQMYRIAGGKRLRNDLRRWASGTITLRGGRLDNSAAHPDAGKVWTFGSYQQPLTDATLYTAGTATLRLSAGTNVSTFRVEPGETADLWIVSSAGPRLDIIDPKRLAHAATLFQYFADADPIIPTCNEAGGRITLATDLPCSNSAIASRVIKAPAGMPPHVDLCPGGGWCDPCV
jgi:hypothetical protein